MGSTSSLIGRGPPQQPFLPAPAAIPRVTPPFISTSIIFRPSILIKPARILRPLDIQPQATKVHVLQRLFGLLSAPLTFELHEGITLLDIGGDVLLDRSCNCRTP